jgi:hypothetical protein
LFPGDMLKLDCVERSGKIRCLFVTRQKTGMTDPVFSCHLTNHQFGIRPDEKIPYTPIPGSLEPGNQSLVFRLVVCPGRQNTPFRKNDPAFFILQEISDGRRAGISPGSSIAIENHGADEAPLALDP